MNYELKNVKPQGLPYIKKSFEPNPQPDKYGIDIAIFTGIVDQQYSGFQNVDITFLELEKADSINEIEAKMLTFGITYVATKYPNT